MNVQGIFDVQERHEEAKGGKRTSSYYISSSTLILLEVLHWKTKGD